MAPLGPKGYGMNKLLLAVALWIGLVGAGFARSVEDQLLATLRAQGYMIVEQGYTFLGRLRVVAENGEIRREIVVNPGTGEILRDYSVMLTAVAATGLGSTDGTALAGDPSPAMGGGTTVGVASASGVTDEQVDDGTMSVTVMGLEGLDAEQTGREGLSDAPGGEDIILTDPIPPFTADGR